MRRIMNNIVNGQQSTLRYLLSVAVMLCLCCGQGLLAQAATIGSLQLLSDQSGDNLRIVMDEAAEYQVFNLEGPSRLVVSFPNASLSKGVNPMPGGGSIENIVPIQDSNGVRIEVGLANGTEYEISEKGNDLLVKFSGLVVASKSADGTLLQDIEVRDRGNVTELILRGQHMDANHNALLSSDGTTMVIDFWGGKSSLPKEYYTYTAQRLNHVAIGATDGRMRLVVALLAGAGTEHQIDASTNEMVVRFGKVKPVARAGAMIVEAIDFQPEDRIAHLVIRTDGTNPIVNLQEKDGKVIIDLKQAQLAPGQERTQDVRAFPGPLKQIDSYAVDKDVRIVARLRQKSVVTSYQTGNVLTVRLKPADMLAIAEANEEVVKDEKIYTGQKVTFNYKDIDIRNALKLIAEMSELNIIMSDDVEGVLTMRLVDVPWDQALDIILTAKGLGKEKNGNVLRIAPLAQLKKDADDRKDAQKSVENIAPLQTEFFQLGYAAIEDVRSILEGDIQKASSTSGDGTVSAASVDSSAQGDLQLLSDRGTILMDTRSNTLIVTDTRARLDNIKRLIERLDKPLTQILIEARIVEATDTFSRDLGVKWGGTYNDGAGKFTNNLSGAAVGTNVVDLGAAVATSGGAIGYTLGTLSGALNLNLELSAAETEGKIKVVSSPRVFTSNLEKAVIKEVQKIPFNVISVANGVTTTTPEFQDAELKLEVLPQVTADKRIILRLVVNKGTPITNAAGTATAITTKTVSTTLLVKNGNTIVLGGIYSETMNDNVTGVPLLRSIPFLGKLFERKQKTKNRNELLIFITPTIISDKALLN